MGSVPDGLFSTVGDALRLLQSPSVTRDAWSTLASILREARDHGTPAERVQARVQAEVPALAALAQAFPRTRDQWYAFLALILAALALLQQCSSDKSASRVTINQVIQQVLPGPTEQRTKAIDRRANKLGRNELCPCGSGKKYKRCCGAR